LSLKQKTVNANIPCLKTSTKFSVCRRKWAKRSVVGSWRFRQGAGGVSIRYFCRPLFRILLLLLAAWDAVRWI
jgi:hypothetical protein